MTKHKSNWLTLLLSGMVALFLIFLVGKPAHADETGYEIYPIPHNVTYSGKSYDLQSNVNVVFDKGIDAATKDRLSAILESKDQKFTVGNSVVPGKTNILVGINGSNGPVDSYAKSKFQIQTGLFSHFDSYFEDSRDGVITILGNNSDGAFEGLTTLKAVYKQLSGNTIQDFTIQDYADTKIRGFIEGYYGIPWSDSIRKSLMQYGGDIKLNAYVFAPKDDPYHRGAHWRDLYPASRLAEIKDLVRVGNESKTRLVYTLHPFGGRYGVTAATYNQSLKDTKAKFDQLYSIGVRQFGILADDVGRLPRNIVVNYMNDLAKWAKAKGDVYDLVFCPGGYNNAWQGNYAELNQYDKQFADNIQIFWTGDGVLGSIENKTLNHFRRSHLAPGQKQRRAPLFWLNWPVNDYKKSRLLMGPGEMLHTDINPSDLVGVVSNPMPEGEASKVALFSVADYAWNVKGFNREQAWEDSFKYVDPDDPADLKILAEQMSNPGPNNMGLVLQESNEIAPYVNAFKQDLTAGNSIAESGQKLINEFQKIADAADSYLAKTQNMEMKAEIQPYAEALRDSSLTNIHYIKAAIALKAGDQATALAEYNKANDLAKVKHFAKTIGGQTRVDPGSTVILPFEGLISSKVKSDISTDVLGKTAFTPESNLNTWYQNYVLANIADGNPNTAAWHDGYEAVGQYYEIKLNQPANVYEVHILNGTSQKPQDTFGYAKVQYTTDGNDWKDVNGQIYGLYPEQVDITGLNLKDVVAVRYIATKIGPGKKWAAMREFQLVTTKPAKSAVYTDVAGLEKTPLTSADNTYSFAALKNASLRVGAYVGFKLDRIHVLDSVDLNVPAGLTLQVSKNGDQWVNITDPATVKGQQARYIRLFNQSDQTVTFDLPTFNVTTIEFGPKKLDDANFTTIDNPDALFDGNLNTQTIFKTSQDKGIYAIYDLGQTVKLKDLKLVLNDSEIDYPRHMVISASTDKQSWTPVMTLGDQNSDNPGEATNTDNIGEILPDHEGSYNSKTVSGLDQPARYLKFEVTRTKAGSDKWIRMQELEINKGQYMPTVNDPTITSSEPENADNLYSNMVDNDLSTAFTATNQSGYILYNFSSEQRPASIKVVQEGISQATVRARLRVGRKYVWVTLGNLDKGINVFTLPAKYAGARLVTLRIQWNHQAPSILELLTR